jgi:peptidoglycan/LPS O-acetylase OafA/YrhL
VKIALLEIVASFVLALASYHLVELPVLRRLHPRLRRLPPEVALNVSFADVTGNSAA